VLALASELGATAILDDRAARRCARAIGVPVLGTFGVVLRAKRRGRLAAAGPVFRAIVAGGLYCDEPLLRALLSSVGERWPEP
jgi:predicted nucleic acid-binding protein